MASFSPRTGTFLFCAFLLGLVATGTANGQVQGCTDPAASNYNAAATANNGSCAYSTVTYQPPVKVDPMSDSLVESSGLQLAGGYLWSFNDGGGATALYRIDTLTSTILQRVYLAGATNVDWEDIAFDGTHFYIGDFGNNANGARTDLKIYKFPLSAIPDPAAAPLAVIPAGLVEQLIFTYADQPQPPQPVAANTTAFDCEAMIVDGGQIHLFSKNWSNVTTTHYLIGSTAAGSYTATPVETLATNYLVTAADKCPGFPMVVLLGYQNSGTASHFMHLLYGYNKGHYFNGNKRLINLPDVLTMGQAEGLAFRDSAYGYISNEKFVRTVGPFTVTIPQKLRSFNIAAYTSVYNSTYAFTGNGNWDIAANWRNGKIPPATLLPETRILIDPIPGGQCILNIPYQLSAGAAIEVMTGKSFLVQGNLTQQN